MRRGIARRQVVERAEIQERRGAEACPHPVGSGPAFRFGAPCARPLDRRHRGQKTIAPPIDAFDIARGLRGIAQSVARSEEHTSELQTLMRNTYAVLCLKKKTEHVNNYS